jgi:hypothetical protein
VVEGARLESVYRGNSIEGSNPSLSASFKNLFLSDFLCITILGNRLGVTLYDQREMTIVPVAWASVDEVSRRIGTLQSKYAGNPVVERIEHELGSDWSGEPSLFLRVILSPGRHDDATLKSLASDLDLDRLRIVNVEDVGLHSYLNFVSQS